MHKSPDAFRTISEVATELDIPQHVLRFWESRFATIRPLKRGGGRRYYRPDDVDLLKGIRHLLYGEGYTIKGVQRILRQEGPRFVQAVGRGEQGAAPPSADDAEPDDFARVEPDSEAGRETPAGPAVSDRASAGPNLPEAAIDRLRTALDELRECERILGSLRDEAP